MKPFNAYSQPLSRTIGPAPLHAYVAPAQMYYAKPSGQIGTPAGAPSPVKLVVVGGIVLTLLFFIAKAVDTATPPRSNPRAS